MTGAMPQVEGKLQHRPHSRGAAHGEKRRCRPSGRIVRGCRCLPDQTVQHGYPAANGGQSVAGPPAPVGQAGSGAPRRGNGAKGTGIPERGHDEARDEGGQRKHFRLGNERGRHRRQDWHQPRPLLSSAERGHRAHASRVRAQHPADSGGQVAGLQRRLRHHRRERCRRVQDAFHLLYLFQGLLRHDAARVYETESAGEGKR